MKALVFVVTILSSPLVFATVQHYQIDSKIFVDGKLVSSPRVITNANEVAEISQVSENSKNELRMRVVASDMTNEHVKDGILMKFDVSYTINGRTIKSSPQILAKTGQPASIEVGDETGKPAMKIELTATRK